MPNRAIQFVEDEYYHVYNRGTDKRNVFLDQKDVDRFIQGIIEFNSPEPIGSIYENSFVEKHQLGSPTSKLVEIVAYCLNPNHFHLLLKQAVGLGIPKFMHRLGTGYTKYFNARYKRSGSLFQGKFKATYVADNNYLLHLSVYINLNNRLHSRDTGFSLSSWNEYLNLLVKYPICSKDIILDQFKTRVDYKNFALETLPEILNKKILDKELERTLID